MKSYLAFILILLLAILSILPIISHGIFPTQDNAVYSRVYEMNKAVHDGMFPVRWVNDFGFGYGYPLFNFYAPLAYYVGSFFMTAMNTNVINATKTMMGIGIILSGISMYIFAKEFWGKSGGIISGLLYVYAPYHALQIYVRGDVAEFWAYALIPFTFYGLWISYVKKSRSAIFIGSIAYASVILSHNLTALMLTPFLLIFATGLSSISSRENRHISFLYPIIIIMLGILISSFYWLPTLTEMKFTNVLSQTKGVFNYQQNFVCLNEMWDSPWNYGLSLPNCLSTMSFMIGKIHIILSIIALITILFLKDRKRQIAILLSAICLVIVLLLTNQITKPIWDTIKPLSFLQFPWRFLILVSFITSFLSGATIWFINQKFFLTHNLLRYAFFGVIILIIIFTNSNYFKQKNFFFSDPPYFSDRPVVSWNFSSDSHEFMPKNFQAPNDVQQIPNQIFSVHTNDVIVKNVTQKTQLIRGFFHVEKLSVIHVNIAYFPAWKFFVDGKRTSSTATSTGMEFTLLPGDHKVELVFIETYIEKLANFLSILGLFILAGIIMLVKKIAPDNIASEKIPIQH